MAELAYLLPRFLRHLLPHPISKFLLRHSIIIKPGTETVAPNQAFNGYMEALQGCSIAIKDKRCMIFGYGGNFSVACALLENGAQHVVLSDWGVKPDMQRNLPLVASYPIYLHTEDGGVVPNKKFITLMDGDIRLFVSQGQLAPLDLIFSSSVFEHLSDVEGIAAALAKATNPEGLQIHFVDLRDHFFRYPFEMLTFSETTWKRWLNPTTNLNRLRVPGFTKIFRRYFENIDITPLAFNLPAFQLAKARIRPEFLSGDDQVDSITHIRILARQPR